MTENAKHILLVSRRDLLIDVVSVFLEGLYPSEIEVADAPLKIENHFAGPARTIDILIVEDEKILQAAGKTLADFAVPTIVVGALPETPVKTGHYLTYLKAPIDLKSLARSFREISDLMGKPSREFCPVRLEVLVLLGHTITQDLYKENPGAGYELIFPKGARLELSDSTFTELSRNRYLFVRSTEFPEFIAQFAVAVQGYASGSEAIFDLSSTITNTYSVHELLVAAIPEFGFTPQIQAATKASIDLAIVAIRKDPRLKDLLESLNEMDLEYRSWHCVALCYLACRLSSLLPWGAANTHFKLSLAAFLHDIRVVPHSLERVNTLEELEAADASEAEKEAYREHPNTSAALARQLKDFPGDVDSIIAQHHELPNGKGFPLGLNHTRITPLSSLFIVAHALADELFDKQDKFKLKDAVTTLEQKYTQGYFARVIAVLKELANKEAAGH